MDNLTAFQEVDFTSTNSFENIQYNIDSAPILVQDEKLKYQKELAELSFCEYKSFSNASNHLQVINNSLENLSSHLENLISKIPNFQNHCNTFLEQSKQFTQQNNKINTILENHTNLLEIIEIPKLMDVCFKNELYSEAMDLSVHVTRLVSKYPSIPLIQQIDNDVKNTIQQMLTKLTKLLSQQIKLPVCLKIIGYLRRMDMFDEPELRLVFLLSRDTYLQSLISELDVEKKDPIFYLKKYIDVFREHFFDTITQYRAIFSEDSRGGGVYPTTPTQSSFSIPSTPSSPWASSPWISSPLIKQLAAVLAEFTAQISDTSSLSSILTQLMYCGMSLGRATQDFLDDLKQAMKNVDLPSLWMISDKKFTIILLDYPPIAYLTNSYLSTFNSLRLVAPVSLFKPLGKFINQNFLSIAESLRDYGNLLVEHKHDTTILQGFNATFAQSFVPFISRCYIDGVYGGLLIDGGDYEGKNYDEQLNQTVV
ncbi:406_t:CDS:2 [Entrophospora sp. SA101]|nr:406_t:CDS:2 [Entrophospora sp. SA101]